MHVADLRATRSRREHHCYGLSTWGVTLFDTANVYGAGHNETIVGQAIAGHRDKVVLASKFSLPMDRTSDRSIDGRPENVRASIGRLGTDYVDMYCQHRVDPDVPVEDTIGAMAELVTPGKVRHLRDVRGEFGQPGTGS